MDRSTGFIALASLAIVIYLGLAVHVVTHNRRRAIAWIFGAFCLSIINYYVTSLFLLPGIAPVSTATPLALRLKWAGLCLSPAFIFHLITFYFPPAWHRYRNRLLLPAYLLTSGLALSALLTNLLVAGPLHRPWPHIIGPLPGPLMLVFALISAVLVVGGTVSLVISYKQAVFPSLKRQILALLIPTGLIILSGLLNWTIVLTRDTGQIPPELVHLFFILIAVFFTGAVVRYGAIAGRPVTRRDLFYSMLAAAAGLGLLSLTLSIDRWLAIQTPFTYPLLTGALVVIVAAGFPALRRWITRRLDPLLFRTEIKQQAMARQLATALSESQDPHQFQKELLSTLCLVLDVRGGYLAFEERGLPPQTLRVRLVQGKVSVNVGDQIQRPALPPATVEPQLVATLPLLIHTSPAWRNIAVFCPLSGESGQNGHLALAEKRDQTSFTPAELTLCSQLTRQLYTAGQMMAMRARSTAYLETTNRQSQTLQQLATYLTSPTYEIPTGWPGEATPPPEAPLAIRLLGPIQVVRNGQAVPDDAWETQKARVLLAYLLWKGPAGATRSDISDALWPDRPIDETANVFHVTLHHLRRVLEPDLERTRDSHYILYSGGKYRFNFEAPHWLDVTAFQKLAAGGEPETLRQAVSLYRSPYLEDAALGLPAEVEVERRRLEQIYLDTLRRLASRTNGHAPLTYLEQLVAVDPLDESAQQALVLSYLARHRRDLARRQVARWQQALAELEVEASSEVRKFWEQVENSDLKKL